MRDYLIDALKDRISSTPDVIFEDIIDAQQTARGGAECVLEWFRRGEFDQDIAEALRKASDE